MTHEEAVSKAAKLLRLATSDNPNEAALAAAKAQEIIDRFKLNADALNGEPKADEPDEPIRNFENPLDGNPYGKASTWRLRLASALARANQCRVWTRGGAAMLVGRPSDAEAVRYLFAYLANEVDGLAKRDAAGNGKAWANNFRLGAVEAIQAKLVEQKKSTQESVKAEASARGGGSAIVLVERAIQKIDAKDAATETWVKENLQLRPRGATRTSYDSGAREAGRKAGREIRLGSARGGLTSGARALGGGK